MATLTYELVKSEIIRAVTEINENTVQVDTIINEDCSPGNFIMSQVLLTAMARIGKKLEVKIPLSCYIFHNKKTKEQLTIKQATEKLINEAING